MTRNNIVTLVKLSLSSLLGTPILNYSGVKMKMEKKKIETLLDTTQLSTKLSYDLNNKDIIELIHF